MIPSMKLTVKYANGAESIVDVKPRTQIAFERKFDTAIGGAFVDEKTLRFEHMFWLAWHASKASQEFDAWLELVDGVEGVDEEVDGAADPTNPVPSAGS